jgi:hypothetical protein
MPERFTRLNTRSAPAWHQDEDRINYLGGGLAGGWSSRASVVGQSLLFKVQPGRIGVGIEEVVLTTLAPSGAKSSTP